MIGNTVSLILLMFTVTIAYVLAADQEDTRLYDQPANYEFPSIDSLDEDGSEMEKRAHYGSPLIRFGKRGGIGMLTRNLRNGPMVDPLIRFGKRSVSDKRLSSSPFIRFGRSFRQSAPHIRFGK